MMGELDDKLDVHSRESRDSFGTCCQKFFSN